MRAGQGERRTVATVPPALVTKVARSPAASVTSLTTLSTPSTISVSCAEARAAVARTAYCWSLIFVVRVRISGGRMLSCAYVVGGILE